MNDLELANVFAVPADPGEWSELAAALQQKAGLCLPTRDLDPRKRLEPDAVILHVRRSHPMADIDRIRLVREQHPDAHLLALSEYEDVTARRVLLRESILCASVHSDEHELRGRIVRLGMVARLWPIVAHGMTITAETHGLSPGQRDIMGKHMRGMTRQHLVDAYNRSASATARVVNRLLVRCGVPHLANLAEIVWAAGVLGRAADNDAVDP